MIFEIARLMLEFSIFSTLSFLLLSSFSSHSVLQHTMALTFSGLVVSPSRYPTSCFHFPKLSLRISCNVIPISQVKAAGVEAKRERRHSVMKLFLLDECGLSPSELPTVMSNNPQLFSCKSTDRAQQALQLFRDSGFTPDHVRKTILRDPSVLIRPVDEQLKPKIDLLKKLGMAEQDVVHVISQQPRILSGSLDKNLTPKTLLLLKLFGSKDRLHKAIRRRPGILMYEFQTLQKKIKIIEDMGLLEHQIHELLRKEPMFLCLSRGKIEKNMEFVTGTLGLHPSIVVKYPVLLSFSVQKRLKPRYKVIKYLNALTPPKCHNASLVSLFYWSELDFTMKFLEGSNELINLYEGYKESLDV